jgi:hypothetical protein
MDMAAVQDYSNLLDLDLLQPLAEVEAPRIIRIVYYLNFSLNKNLVDPASGCGYLVCNYLCKFFVFFGK